MSLCEYCGQNTGWLHSSHAACVTKAKSVGQTVQQLVFDGAMAGRSFDELWPEVHKMLTDNAVSFEYVRDAAYQGINDAASQTGDTSRSTRQTAAVGGTGPRSTAARSSRPSAEPGNGSQTEACRSPGTAKEQTCWTTRRSAIWPPGPPCIRT